MSRARLGRFLLLVLLVPSISYAQQRRATPILASQLRWVQFRIVSGRVLASCPQINRSMQSSSTGEGRRETLSISHADGGPVVNYSLTTPEEQISIVSRRGTELLIRRVPQADQDTAAIDFSQIPDRLLFLHVRGQGQQRTYEGASLWHLLLIHPDATKQHLIPLLELLRPDWRLTATAAAIERTLLESAPNWSLADRERWAQLVKDLGSDQFAQRQAADRGLRTAGVAVLPFLQGLNPHPLDAEQRIRVRRIITTLSAGEQDDRPDRVAASLASDEQIWLAFLARPDEHARRIAAQRLGVLLGMPIDFDPAADETIRAAQLELVRQKLDALRPTVIRSVEPTLQP